MTEDEDYGIELDLPAEWTEEEIRGIRRFMKVIFDVAHLTERDHVRNAANRAALNAGLALEEIKLPKAKRRRRSVKLPDGSLRKL